MMKSIFAVDLSQKTFQQIGVEQNSEKARILKFLCSFNPVSVTGIISDFQTGEWTKQENLDFEDGDFYWSSSDIYHFDKYNLKLNDDFIQHVLNRPE